MTNTTYTEEPKNQTPRIEVTSPEAINRMEINHEHNPNQQANLLEEERYKGPLYNREQIKFPHAGLWPRNYQSETDLEIDQDPSNYNTNPRFETQPMNRQNNIISTPLPGTPNAPQFNGQDLAEFIGAYELMAEMGQWDERMMCRQLHKFCGKRERELVTSLQETGGNNWNILKRELDRHYIDDNFKKH